MKHGFIPEGWDFFFYWLVIQKCFSVTLSTEKYFMRLQEIAAKVNAWSYIAVILYNFVIALPVRASSSITRKAFYSHC